MSELIAKAAKRNPAKISPTVLATLSKFYVKYLESGDLHLIQELVDHHAATVNPRELVVRNAFYLFLVTEETLRKAPNLRHYLLLTQYTKEKCRAVAGGASQAAFLEATCLTQLVKKPDLVQTVEEKIREIRVKYLEVLEKNLSPEQARLELAIYMDLIIRCLLAKPWPVGTFQIKLPVGRFSAEKVFDLGVIWAQHVDWKHPALDFAKTSGLVANDTRVSEDASEMVNLENARVLKKTSQRRRP